MQVPHFNPKINPVIDKVFKENLFLNSEDKFLIATDYPSPLDVKFRETDVLQRIFERNFLAKYIQKRALENFSEVETDLYAFPCQWRHYPKELPELEQKVKEYTVIYILSEFSVSNLFWSTVINEQDIRMAFSPTGDETIFLPRGPLDINSKKLEGDVMHTYAKLKNGQKAKLWNHMGTSIEVDVSNARVGYESGILDYQGKRANLPAGEVSLFRTVIDGKYVVPAGWIEKLNHNLIIEIENNTIVGIKHEQEESSWLNEHFYLKRGAKINQLAIGHNKRATNPFLPIELTKMRGLAVLGLGLQTLDHFSPLETRTFIGQFPSPNIYLEVDGEQIFKNGRYLL